MFVDNYIPGEVEAGGPSVMKFAGRSFDPGMRRPYFDSKGRVCVTLNTGRTETRKTRDGSLICNAAGEPVQFPVYRREFVSNLMQRGIWCPVWNATTLRKDDWLMLDKAVLKAARDRLRAWDDLAASNTFGGFNGMGKIMLEHEIMTDAGEAIIDMEGTTPGRTDSVKYQLEGLPLPITHSDFTFSERRLAVSRNGGTPLDVTMGEQCARRVAEKVEDMTIGELDLSSVSFGGTASDYGDNPYIYGYITAPNRITKTDLTAPTGSNPNSTLTDVLAMIGLAEAQNFYGPYMLYHSKDFGEYMDNDYAYQVTAGSNYGLGVNPSMTLRDRLKKIPRIRDVRQLDRWDDTTSLLLIQMTGEVARAVNGMEMTTVQWEGKGGLELMFKIMCIKVPQIRSQYVGTTTTKKTGIVHASTS